MSPTIQEVRLKNLYTFEIQTVGNIDIESLDSYTSLVKDRNSDSLYKAFGKLMRMSRETRDGMTQEKLGRLVGLSRTSITNIEKGRQHVSLHQLFAIAEALKVRPDALLPATAAVGGDSGVTQKLPPDTDREIAEWAEKVVGEYVEREKQ